MWPGPESSVRSNGAGTGLRLPADAFFAAGGSEDAIRPSVRRLVEPVGVVEAAVQITAFFGARALVAQMRPDFGLDTLVDNDLGDDEQGFHSLGSPLSPAGSIPSR